MESSDVFRGGRRLQRSLVVPTVPPHSGAEELAAQVDELTGRVAALEHRLHENGSSADAAAAHGWVAFVATPAGYLVYELDGAAPAAGETVAVGAGRFVVGRLGPSPFPDDARPCAFGGLVDGTPPLASAAWQRSTS